MKRPDLHSWLKEPGKTWRWNRGETDGYDAVEARGERLRWYRWSHDDGPYDVLWQPKSLFLASGPPRAVPSAVKDAVVAYLNQSK